MSPDPRKGYAIRVKQATKLAHLLTLSMTAPTFAARSKASGQASKAILALRNMEDATIARHMANASMAVWFAAQHSTPRPV